MASRVPLDTLRDSDDVPCIVLVTNDDPKNSNISRESAIRHEFLPDQSTKRLVAFVVISATRSLPPFTHIDRARRKIMSDRHEHGPAEKRFIVNAYTFFENLKNLPCFIGRRTRDLVAECLSCSEVTVKRVRSEWLASGDATFDVTSLLHRAFCV